MSFTNAYVTLRQILGYLQAQFPWLSQGLCEAMVEPERHYTHQASVWHRQGPMMSLSNNRQSLPAATFLAPLCSRSSPQSLFKWLFLFRSLGEIEIHQRNQTLTKPGSQTERGPGSLSWWCALIVALREAEVGGR